MLTTTESISVASLFPAVIIAILLYRKNVLFRPFLVLILISGFIELAAFFLRYQSLNNVWLYNIAILMQYFLMIWQLEKWGLFSFRAIYIKVSVVIISLLWIIETIYYRNQSLNNYTLVLCSVILIIFITAYINRLIFENVRFLLTDSRFLISIGYLIYFTVNLIVFIFTPNNNSFSPKFFTNIWAIHNIVNTFTNIIFTIALLCIPKK